jgi:hypothetical protein
MEHQAPYGCDMTAAQLANTCYLGGDVYVTWDGRALHLLGADPSAAGPVAPAAPWIRLRPDMLHALLLFLEARRLP